MQELGVGQTPMVPLERRRDGEVDAPDRDGRGRDRPAGERNGREAVNAFRDQRRHERRRDLPRARVGQIAVDLRGDAAVVSDLDLGEDARAAARGRRRHLI